MTFAEIMQLERHIEEGSMGLLKEACANIYPARSTDVAKSPRIEVKAVVGSVANHAHPLDQVRWVYDVFNGNLRITIKTNRETENKSEAHNLLLGECRARLQQFKVTENWRKYQDVVLVTDIREDSTDDSEVDPSDLDVSLLNHILLFNINPEVWPSNL